MKQNNESTAAVASIDEVADCAARADAQIRAVLRRVMAQRRSVGTACGYVTALAAGVMANCWALAESAGHEGWGRMQALLSSYRWDWAGLRAELPALAAAWIPCTNIGYTGMGGQPAPAVHRRRRECQIF